MVFLMSFDAELPTISGREVLNHDKSLYVLPENMTETAQILHE